MAECMDDVLYTARLEQEDEITVLQSIFDDNFHLLGNNNSGEDGERISMTLSLKVHVPLDSVLVEAVIPIAAHEPVVSSSDSDSCEENSDPVVGIEEREREVNGVASELDEQGATAAAYSTPQTTTKKPGLSRLLSTKHWHIQSEVCDLTPVNLWCQFPPLYPSVDMPQFRLSCHWLTGQQLRGLTEQLEVIWQDNINMPIVYMWADWLQNNTWEFLRLNPHIILREEVQGEPMPGNSHFTISNKLPLDLALLAIFEHDIKVRKEEFMKSRHSCEICFDEKEGPEFCFIDECGHYYCMECMQYHCEMHVESGTVTRLRCPNHECDAPIPPLILQEILKEEKYERWERLLLSKTLDMMRDIFYCPRCNAAVVADEEELSRLAQCVACFYAFCTECQGPWHHGKSCEQEEADEETCQEEKKKKSEQKTGNKESDNEDDEDDETKRKKARKTAFMSSRKFIAQMKTKGFYRNCPSCRMVVEKTYGCNFMHCAQCGQGFCWACGKCITCYSHFEASPACTQYDNQLVPVQVRQAPSPGEQLIANYKRNNPDKPVHTKNCTQCHQRNLKVLNNNHLKCWACKTNFCYKCGKKIEGGYKHFIPPSTCTQHSDD